MLIQEACRQTDRQTGRQTDRQIDRQVSRKTGRQANGQLESYSARCRVRMYEMDIKCLYLFVYFSLFLLGVSFANKALVNL